MASTKVMQVYRCRSIDAGPSHRPDSVGDLSQAGISAHDGKMLGLQVLSRSSETRVVSASAWVSCQEPQDYFPVV